MTKYAYTFLAGLSLGRCLFYPNLDGITSGISVALFVFLSMAAVATILENKNKTDVG